MDFDLFEALVRVVNRADSGDISDGVRAAAVDQVWRHALTRADSADARVWVAASRFLTGEARAQVLACTDPVVRQRVVINPVLTDDERRGLLTGRAGVSLLATALTTAEDPDVLASLYEEVARRWDSWSASTQARITAAACQGMETANWMCVAYEDEPGRDRLRAVLPRVAQLVLPSVLLTRVVAQSGETLLPSSLGVVVSQVSERDISALIEGAARDEIPGLHLWAVLAVRRPLSRALVAEILDRLANQDDWTPDMLTSHVRSMRVGLDFILLEQWDLHIDDHPELIADLATRAASGPQGEVWRKAGALASALLAGPPATAPVDAVLERFGAASRDHHQDLIEAVALRTDIPMLVRFNAWTTWHERDADAAELAAREHGRLPELIAALAEIFVDGVDEVLDAHFDTEQDRRACALDALVLLREHLPGDARGRVGAERVLLPLTGPQGLLILPWSHVADFVTGPGSMATQTGAQFVELALDRLTGPEDWELFDRLAAHWTGTTGELLDTIDALRIR